MSETLNYFQKVLTKQQYILLWPTYAKSKTTCRKQSYFIKIYFTKEDRFKRFNARKIGFNNSFPREKLSGKTPYETFKFIYGKNILERLNIKEIKKDDVNLTPSLLK